MKTLIFASSNSHKLEEVRRIFKLYKILSLKDIGFDQEIIEDGYTIQENANIKANAIREFIKDKPLLNKFGIISDDTGLFVKAIDYEPGIMSARYSGGSDADNRKKILSKLTTIQDRTAYFQCCATLLLPDGTEYSSEGKTFGLITKEEIGNNSFGYDCIFWSDKLRKTFGQATAEEKDVVSHRGVAMKQIKQYLESINYMVDDEDED